mgnify:CR=1 FL=1
MATFGWGMVYGMPNISLTILAAATLLASPQDTRPDADALVQEAWLFLPEYSGEHRASLSEVSGRDTLVAIHLLEAATVLEPDHLGGLWALGHACSLMGEDRKSRGLHAEAQELQDMAITTLTHGLQLNPSDPWAAYARGVAYCASGQPRLALVDFDLAITNSEAQLRDFGDSDALSKMRFQALFWRSETLMQARQFETARTAIDSFHTEFSNNAWPLHIAMAESHEREWDLDSAKLDYTRAVELFPEDHQAYALIAYIDGLLGDHSAATDGLQRAIQLEQDPGLYTRLWWLILATSESSPEAETELRDFMSAAPSTFGAWDLRLGHFMLGEGTPEDFLDAAKLELARRLEASEDPDDLMCEAYFYAGLRLLRDGHQERPAAEYFSQSLRQLPGKWKWEWAYSRYFLSKLNAEHALEVEKQFTIENGFFSSPTLAGELIEANWSLVGEGRTRTQLGRAPQFGDLLLGTVLTKKGESIPIVRIVGVRMP